jgi:hypothetical protein
MSSPKLAAAFGHPLGYDAAVWRRRTVEMQIDSDQEEFEINANSGELNPPLNAFAVSLVTGAKIVPNASMVSIGIAAWS